MYDIILCYFHQAITTQPFVVTWHMGLNFNQFAGGLYGAALQNDNLNGCLRSADSTDHCM